MRFDIHYHADPQELRRLDRIIDLLGQILKAVQEDPGARDAVRGTLTPSKPQPQGDK